MNSGSEPSRVKDSYTEVIGNLEEVGEDYITLSSLREYIIHTRQGEPARWLLKRGSKVAILLLDDGAIRVRILDEKTTKRTKGVRRG